MTRALCVALPLAALACSEPTPPSRADTYPFAFGGDVFHWPAERLPVRFYAHPTGNLPEVVRRAINGWALLVLYGEFTGQLVSDSIAADVIVYADSAPDVPPDPGPPVNACTGVTSFPPIDADNRYTGPLHIHLSAQPGPGITAAHVQACMRRTAIHEVGHALGLFQHSLDPGDIMYAPPAVGQPSERDRRTVEVLYHTPPTLFPAP